MVGAGAGSWWERCCCAVSVTVSVPSPLCPGVSVPQRYWGDGRVNPSLGWCPGNVAALMLLRALSPVLWGAEVPEV